MNDEGSITAWIDRLQDRDEEAARRVFERYYNRLVELCRRRLGGRAADRDEEDLALSAFDTFFRRAADGGFPRLDDRDDVVKVLTCIAVRKVLAEQRRQQAGLRGRIHLETDLPADGQGGLGERVRDQHGPEHDPEVADTLDEILRRLDQPALREIVAQRLEGRSVREIAERMDVPPRRVEYKLQIIRATLKPLVAQWVESAASVL